MSATSTANDGVSASEAVHMTLEQARQVRWVRPNTRPIGELLDQGILNRDRLQWAADNAYNPRLKQAAKVILESLSGMKAEPSTSKGTSGPQSTILNFRPEMTVQQARATPWPFGDFRGRPLGELLDAGLITARDLGGVIERAYDPRVKQAAMILMLKRIDQVVEESPTSGAVSVISGGRSYMLWRQFELVLYAGILVGGLIGAGLLLGVWSLQNTARALETNSINRYPPLAIVFALLIFGVLSVVALLSSRWLGDRIFRSFAVRINRLRRGQEGEDRVADTILPALDGEWTVFRNVVLPGRKYDLDMILAGPAGVWVLEIKAYQGAYRASGKRWDRYSGGRWQKMPKNPGAQVATNAGMLSNFLKENGAQLWVEPVVVWANPESPLTLEEPNPQVWIMENLRDEVGNLFSRHAAKPKVIQQAVELLTKICEDAGRARAEEAER